MTGKTIPVYTKEKEEQFLKHIEGAKWLIKYYLSRCPLLRSESDRQDCYQEILISAWLNYYKWEPRGNLEFKSWLRNDIKFGLKRFIQKMFRYRKRYALVEDISIYGGTDDEYSEDLFKCLQRALSDLSYQERDRVLSVFSETSLYTEWADPRKRGSKLREEIFYIIEKIKANKTAWNIEDIPALSKSKNSDDNGHFFESTAIARPIEQLDMDGKFIKLWPSARAASVYYGYNYKNIQAVADGRRVSCSGYKWRYQGEERSEILNREKQRGGAEAKPIVQLDLSGNPIKIWPSLFEASKAGFTPSLIRKTIKGKVNHHGGYKWGYHS